MPRRSILRKRLVGLVAMSCFAAALLPLVGASPVSAGTCFGRSGSDGTGSDDSFSGTTSSDVWSGLAGNDAADGKAGNDFLCGNAGRDGANVAPADFLGGSDDDSLSGGNDNDTLKGEGGADTLEGDDGADVLYGMDQNDHLDGGNDLDADDIHAGAGGSDVCVVRYNDVYWNGECEVFV